MLSSIGWSQLTAAQQQKIPAEYQNKDIPISVIEDSGIELSAAQKSIFNGTSVQKDEITYKVTDYETEPRDTSFWDKAAEVGKKVLVGSGVGIAAGQPRDRGHTIRYGGQLQRLRRRRHAVRRLLAASRGGDGGGRRRGQLLDRRDEGAGGHRADRQGAPRPGRRDCVRLGGARRRRAADDGHGPADGRRSGLRVARPEGTGDRRERFVGRDRGQGVRVAHPDGTRRVRHAHRRLRRQGPPLPPAVPHVWNR